MQRLWKCYLFMNGTWTGGQQVWVNNKQFQTLGTYQTEPMLSLGVQVHLWHNFKVGRSDNSSFCHCSFHSLALGSGPLVAFFSTRLWGSCTSKTAFPLAFLIKCDGIVVILHRPLPVGAVRSAHRSLKRIQLRDPRRASTHSSSNVQLHFYVQSVEDGGGADALHPSTFLFPHLTQKTPHSLFTHIQNWCNLLKAPLTALHSQLHWCQAGNK